MMAYSFILDEAATLDFEESYRWYAERSLQAADHFEAAVNARIAVICESPFRYPVTYRHFRETALKDFPFKIVYSADDALLVVIVTAIYHYRRDPEGRFRGV